MLEELREKVLECARAAERIGLCRRLSGNFSARDEATGLICVTPSGGDRESMTPSDIVVTDASGAVIEANENARPTSELLMHLAAYEERPDAFAVAHTHSRFALVMAVLRQPVPPVLLESAHIGSKDGFIPVAPFAKNGTRELADSVRSPLRESDAVLLASHGVLTVGRDLSGALLKAEYAEEIAEAYCFARLMAGKEPPRLTPDELELKKW